MSYLANYNRGLGFAETFPDASVDSLMIGPVDVGSWDWHEWALAGVVVYVALKYVVGGAKRAAGAIAKPIKTRRKKSARRSAARKRYREEMESIG